LLTNVSGQHIGPIFKGQEPEKKKQNKTLDLEDRTDTLSQNIGKQLLHEAA
jgi:hypothetical protein